MTKCKYIGLIFIITFKLKLKSKIKEINNTVSIIKMLALRLISVGYFHLHIYIKILILENKKYILQHLEKIL